MLLRGVGNPDFQQYADIAPTVRVARETVEELKEEYIWYRTEHDMGGGNCGREHGVVFEKADGGLKYVGRFSYNGRYWDKDSDSGDYLPTHKDLSSAVAKLSKCISIEQLKELIAEEEAKWQKQWGVAQ